MRSTAERLRYALSHVYVLSHVYFAPKHKRFFSEAASNETGTARAEINKDLRELHHCIIDCRKRPDHTHIYGKTNTPGCDARKCRNSVSPCLVARLGLREHYQILASRVKSLGRRGRGDTLLRRVLPLFSASSTQNVLLLRSRPWKPRSCQRSRKSQIIRNPEVSGAPIGETCTFHTRFLDLLAIVDSRDIINFFS